MCTSVHSLSRGIVAVAAVRAKLLTNAICSGKLETYSTSTLRTNKKLQKSQQYCAYNMNVVVVLVVASGATIEYKYLNPKDLLCAHI